MLIDQIEDDTYTVYLDQSDKDALFAIAMNRNVPPAELLEHLLLTCLHFLCDKQRQLHEKPPPSPGMPSFGLDSDSSRTDTENNEENDVERP